MDIDTVAEHFAIAALWSERDGDGSFLDDCYSIHDIAPDTMAKIRDQCEDFLSLCEGDENGGDLIGDMAAEQFGHDFLLTRNRHGVGFWDRGLGERGKRLTEYAEAYGECSFYVGDDGLIHGSL